MYKIVRFYQAAGIRSRVIETGLTRKEAEDHCSNPESSSVTCTSKVGRRRTREIGDWFDGWRRAA